MNTMTPIPGTDTAMPSSEDLPCTASLPFVRRATPEEISDGSFPLIFWNVDPSGDYNADFETGSSYARSALSYMVSKSFTPLLGWVVSDMMRVKRDHSGVEIGFMNYFACAAAGGR